MKIAVMQPYLFPYLGYFQLIQAVDIFVIFDDVNYINRGWINRNRILTERGEQLITLKLSKASQNKLINEIAILDTNENKECIYNKIKLAYTKAPQFSKVMPLLEKALFQSEQQLSRYIEFSLKVIAEYLQIKTRFIRSSNIEKDASLKSQEKILAIIKKLGGKSYYNSIGGLQLYDKQIFHDHGIQLHFIEMDDIRYRQFDDNYYTCLSIIDPLMFNDQSTVCELLNRYTLK